MEFFNYVKKLIGIGNEDATNPLENEESDLLEDAWEEREDIVYKKLFKDIPDSVYSPEDPSDVVIGGDLLMLACWGVYEIPPSEDRDYWVYLTTGLSNPLEDTVEEISGFGCELMIRLPKKSPWAINLLFNLMGYVLTTEKPFEQGHRMPLNSPIQAGSDTALNTILFWAPEDMQGSLELKSGEFQLLDLIGITEDEFQFAKANSSEALISKLKQLPNFPVTDVERSSCL